MSKVNMQMKDYIREYCRKWRKLHPEYNKVFGRKYNAEYRFKVLIHYGGSPPKCACCGETQVKFLTLDHTNGGGTQHRKEINRRGVAFYRWLIDNGFPEGFQVMCMNCNFAKRKGYRFCPVHHPEEYKNC